MTKVAIWVVTLAFAMACGGRRPAESPERDKHETTIEYKLGDAGDIDPHLGEAPMGCDFC